MFAKFDSWKKKEEVHLCTLCQPHIRIVIMCILTGKNKYMEMKCKTPSWKTFRWYNFIYRCLCGFVCGLWGCVYTPNKWLKISFLRFTFVHTNVLQITLPQPFGSHLICHFIRTSYECSARITSIFSFWVVQTIFTCSDWCFFFFFLNGIFVISPTTTPNVNSVRILGFHRHRQTFISSTKSKN